MLSVLFAAALTLRPGAVDVVLAPDAPKATQIAADEMTNLLAQVFGRAVPVVTRPTDGRKHVIGKDVEFDEGWDTPTLREAWRTAPYLFDGRAATMEEVFTVHKHGLEGRSVDQKDIDKLVEYVNSL